MRTRREILRSAASLMSIAGASLVVRAGKGASPPAAEARHIVRLALRSDPRDQSKAWDDAIAEASSRATHGQGGLGIVELEPGARYVGAPSRQGERSEDIQPAFGLLKGTPNVLVRTRGAPPLGDARQAILAVSPWEDQRGVRWQCVTRLSGNDQHLQALRIDGGKFSTGTTQAGRENWLARNADYSKGGNGGIHCIGVRGGRGNSITDLEVYDALTDGIDIDEDENGQVTMFTAARCDFHHNRRQGMTTKRFGVADGGRDQVTFRACRFRWTGDDDRGMPGERPGAGVDMEPNHSGDRSYGGTFVDCECLENRGSTFDKGAAARKSAGRGFTIENKGQHTDLQIIRLTCLRNRGAVKINMRGQDIVNLYVERLVGRDNGEGNLLHFARSGGKLIGCRLVDIDVSEIRFDPDLDPTGHSVTIWRGTHSPKVTAAAQSIIINGGMP
jgi:hypothetical protein